MSYVEVRKLDTDDLLMIIVLFILWGWIWAIPREDIYNTIALLVSGAITAGWIYRKRRKK